MLTKMTNNNKQNTGTPGKDCYSEWQLFSISLCKNGVKEKGTDKISKV